MKTNKGITLIALVITIIVLLILAGVSISMLTGENGILTQANTAKEKTEIAEAKERAQLDIASWQAEQLKDNKDANLTDGIIKTILTGKDYVGTVKDTSFTTKKSGYGINYFDLYNLNGSSSLPSTAETTPYLPDDKSTVIDNSTLETGLVVKDKNNNEWVWIEVPKSITASSTLDTEIETALQTYATSYRNSSYSDTWYEGCGLGETEYNENKTKMLKSIKTNGGFWIGRYEAGTDIQRIAKTDPLTPALSQLNKYPYNWVTEPQAQERASTMTPDSKYKSSLMFGIQWDLVCRYLEEKGIQLGNTKVERQTKIKVDSSTWGNCLNAAFEITKGKYSEDNGTIFKENMPYQKIEDSRVLVATGVSERNKVLNIYDFAGNEYEWTLEKSTSATNSCTYRGGGFNDNASGYPSSYRIQR